VSGRRQLPTRLDAARQATGDPSLHTLVVGRSRSRRRRAALVLLFGVLLVGLVVGSPWVTTAGVLVLLGVVAGGRVLTIAIGDRAVVAFRSRVVDLSFGPDYVTLGRDDVALRSDRSGRRSGVWVIDGTPVAVSTGGDHHLRALLASWPGADTDAPSDGAVRNGNSSRDLGS
jgi:hypothetical protein